MTEKQKVICDANVWYQLAEKGFEAAPELKNYQLCITNLTIFEIISSETIIENFNLTKKIIILIKENAEIIPENDIQQVILSQLSGYSDELIERQENTIDRLFNTFSNAKSIKDIDFNYEKQIKLRESETEEWSKRVLNVLKANDLSPAESYLKAGVSEYLNKYRPDIVLEDCDFSKFELFIDCFSRYLKHKQINKTNKKPENLITKNDYIDFRNLLYCTEEYKYLTFEVPKGSGKKSYNIAYMLETSPFAAKYLLPDNNIIRKKVKC